MKDINIGIIGLGTIGKGVYDSLMSNGDVISRKSGLSVQVEAVCEKDKSVISSMGLDKNVKVLDPDNIVKEDGIDIIVELIGGIEPARSIILEALRNKKHVITANKALLSEHWKEIFSVAEENGVAVYFEASVGGAIPLIKVIRESFIANRIDTVYGILNGTTNFILSEMSDKGISFAEALAAAQKKGIAEKNPELDISGMDSAHKLGILSVLGFGCPVLPSDIYTEGIENIEPDDIANAAEWDYSIKLLAIAKRSADGLQLRVHPTLLPASHILSGVKGADNAVFIKGDLIGESLLFGKGAGSKPTASSVIADIVSVGKSFFREIKPSYSKILFSDGETTKSRIDDLVVPYYLRFSAIDKPGVLAGIASILAKNDIGIANVSQEERNKGESVPVVILTHGAREGSMKKAVNEIDRVEFITDKTIVIRIEE